MLKRAHKAVGGAQGGRLPDRVQSVIIKKTHPKATSARAAMIGSLHYGARAPLAAEDCKQSRTAYHIVQHPESMYITGSLRPVAVDKHVMFVVGTPRRTMEKIARILDGWPRRKGAQ